MYNAGVVAVNSKVVGLVPDVTNQLLHREQQDVEAEPAAKKKKRPKLAEAARKRSLCDPRPLEFNDGHLAAAVKDIVEQIHGDFGKAAVTIGF
jgi:hypothetical protein